MCVFYHGWICNPLDLVSANQAIDKVISNPRTNGLFLTYIFDAGKNTCLMIYVTLYVHRSSGDEDYNLAMLRLAEPFHAKSLKPQIQIIRLATPDNAFYLKEKFDEIKTVQISVRIDTDWILRARCQPAISSYSYIWPAGEKSTLATGSASSRI